MPLTTDQTKLDSTADLLSFSLPPFATHVTNLSFFSLPMSSKPPQVERPIVTQLPLPRNLASATSRLNLRLAHDWSLSLSLSLSLNLTRYECFCLVLFLLCLYIKKWYYIFVWKLRKCEQPIENVFSIAFSRTQSNI